MQAVKQSAQLDGSTVLRNADSFPFLYSSHFFVIRRFILCALMQCGRYYVQVLKRSLFDSRKQ